MSYTNDQIAKASQQIDDHYNSLIYEGMPMDDYYEVQEQRNAAHANVAKKVLNEPGWAKR